jgi:hypothetical protein
MDIIYPRMRGILGYDWWAFDRAGLYIELTASRFDNRCGVVAVEP